MKNWKQFINTKNQGLWMCWNGRFCTSKISKLISRKIWMIEKSWNFHTVLLEFVITNVCKRICQLNYYWFQIQWMQNPQPLNWVLNSNIFGCNFNDRPQRCPRRGTKKCSLKFRGDVRQWASCQSNTCPNRYPWVNNLSGN